MRDRIAESEERRAGRELLERSSLGAPLPYEHRVVRCIGPLGFHEASAAAKAADVNQTRCVSCRKRIYKDAVRGRGWRIRLTDE